MSSPSKICVAIGNLKREDVLKILREEKLCELRLDLIPEFEPLEELVNAGARCIVTCRSAEGIDDSKKLELLKRAAKLKVYAIDLESEAPPKIRQEVKESCVANGVKFIWSHHDFDKTPDLATLEKIREQAFSDGADIFKVATQVNTRADLTRLFSLLEDTRTQVIVGMGELGKISRIVGPHFGSLFTFVAPEKELATAPGQLSRSELRDIWKVIGEPK